MVTGESNEQRRSGSSLVAAAAATTTTTTTTTKKNMRVYRSNREKMVKSRSVADLRCCNASSLAVQYLGQGTSCSKADHDSAMLRYPDEAMAPLCIPGTEIESAEFKKRKHERFQKLFFNVPSTELLVGRFSCAYVTEKGALIQGQLYVSRNWICFYSNIFGMKKTIEIPVSSVKQISKERTAKIFPNAVGIVVESGQHYLFGSLISRNNTHQLLSTLLERSRIMRDYSMSACGVAAAELHHSKELVDASAGDDHGDTSSSSEDESLDEVDNIRHSPSANGTWAFSSAVSTPIGRRSKDQLGSASLHASSPEEACLRRAVRLQLLTIILVVILLISFVYLVYSNAFGREHYRQEHGSYCVANEDLASIERTSATLMQTIASLQRIRSDMMEMRDALAAL